VYRKKDITPIPTETGQILEEEEEALTMFDAPSGLTNMSHNIVDEQPRPSRRGLPLNPNNTSSSYTARDLNFP
jgi:hypothetical protein